MSSPRRIRSVCNSLTFIFRVRRRFMSAVIFVGFILLSYKITLKSYEEGQSPHEMIKLPVKKDNTIAIPVAKQERKTCNKSDPSAIRCWIGEDTVSPNGIFDRMIKARVGPDNTIFLASVDLSFLDMALNMYETSFQRFDMKNFLYVCSDAESVVLLKEKGIECFHYEQDTDNTHASVYNTKNFILKMRVKMKMITAALMLKYTVVLTDVDIVFFRNPLPHMRSSADVAFMDDVSMDNCGFYIARPTKAAIKLHQDTLYQCMTGIIPDQLAMRNVIMKMGKTLRKVRFSREEFPCGLVFYENGKRMFAMDNPCRTESCKANVVHNNWIVGKEAKIYRFKETGMWQYETDGYYSDGDRRYLMYQNGVDFGEKTKYEERRALGTALTIGRILNRTVILPMFTCKGCKEANCKIGPDHCALNAQFKVKTFDRYFKNLYREHVFLSHPKVPTSVKESISPLFAIKTDREMVPVAKKATVFTPNNPKSGPTVAEIRSAFGTRQLTKYSVLNFQSFYFYLSDIDKKWMKTLENGIKPGSYRQH